MLERIEKAIRKKILNWLLKEGIPELKIGDNTIVVTGSTINLANLTADPPLAEGKLWYRADLDRLQYAISTATKREIPYGTINVDQHASRHTKGGADELSLDATQLTTGRLPMARMPDGAAGKVLTAQGIGLDPIWSDVQISTDRVTAPPAAESDYRTPPSAAASSEYGVKIEGQLGGGTPMYAGYIVRVAQRLPATVIGGRTVKRVEFGIERDGTPSGTVYFRVRRVDNDAVVAELGSIAASSVPTTGAFIGFDGEWTMPTGVDLRFCVEYSGGDANNYILVHYTTTDIIPGYQSYYITAWTDETNLDMAIKIYTHGYIADSIDDNINTYWSPNPPNQTNAWIRFDLGSVLAGVAGCRVYWHSDANYRPQAYKIQASVNGSTWDDVVVENTQPPAGWVEYSWIARAETRYLRILILQHGSSGTRVNEFDYYQSNIWRHGHKGG